jgi:hypothetical protein
MARDLRTSRLDGVLKIIISAIIAESGSRKILSALRNMKAAKRFERLAAGLPQTGGG